MAIQNTITNYIKRARITNRIGVSALFSFGLLLLFVVLPLYNVTGVEDSEAATSYNPSESSIIFTTGRNTAIISGTPTTSGTFISSSDATAQVASFNVTTNNATGYTLSIAAKDSNSDGVIDTSLTNGSATLSALTANTTTNAGITATDFNKDTYNNMWGYMPSKVGSSDNTGTNAKFYPMSSTARTLDTTSGANSTANNYTIKLGARINYDQAAGTYTVASGTSFILTAVGNAANYSITYNKNTNDTVTNLPSSTGTMSTSSSSISLSNNTVTRTGYDFLGYCTVATSDQTSVSNGSTACTNAGGIYYAKGGTFYIDETTKNVTTLYAIWYLKDITVTGVFGGTGVTAINFSNATYGKKPITTNNGTTTLKYGITYTLSGSYSDGSEFDSWSVTGGMISSTSSASTTYSATSAATVTLNGKSSAWGYMQDLNVSTCKSLASSSNLVVLDRRDNSDYTVRYINDACWMTQNLRITGTISSTDSNFSHTTSFNTAAGGDLRGSGYTYTAAQSHRADDTDVSSSSSASGGPYTINQLGAWYNYCAASAGQVCSQTQASATRDICPANWHLPSYNTAPGSISGITSQATAFSPIYGGGYNNGSPYNATSYGYWWSATAYEASNQYYLGYSNGSLYTYFSGLKSLGYYVRCVMTPDPIKNNMYMQDVTAKNVADTEENVEYTLTDRRDSKTYTVKKLNGQLWMTQNLRITGSISSTYSNFSTNSTWNVSAGDLNKNITTSDYSTYIAARIHSPSSNYDSAALNLYSADIIGVWYNYCAASAGTVCNNTESKNATEDICPKNWRLPTKSEFTSLVNNIAASDFSPIYGGYYYDGSLNNATTHGFWWSATTYDANSQYTLSYGYDRLYTGYGKVHGGYVRCVRTS